MIAKILAMIDSVRETVKLLRNGLIRFGTVESVDTTAGTVVVKYSAQDPSGDDVLSYSMPWVQRSNENRVPPVGDHVIVLDPSLGSGQAVALVGWNSSANPPVVDDGTEVLCDVQTDTKVLTSGKLYLYGGDGVDIASASDYVALSTPTDDAVAAIQQKLDTLIATFNAHIHVTTATVGASGTPGVIAPTTTTETPVGAQGSTAASDTRAS